MLARLRARLLPRAHRFALLASASAQHTGPPPDLAGTVEVETTFARLLVESRDEVMTPALVSTAGWEPGETALFGERVRPGMTVVDVGAHIGYFTCLAARLVGPRGLVVAFEPGPRNFELLRANVWRNGFANVVCLPWALGAEHGFSDLYLSSRNTGDNRLIAPDDDHREQTTVRVAALDAAGLVRPPVDLVKIDVQGAEEAALRGMEQTLAQSPSILVTLEFWPAGLVRMASEPTAFLAYCRRLGFTIRVQDPDKKGLLDLSDPEILKRCDAGDGEGHVNLVLERERSP